MVGQTEPTVPDAMVTRVDIREIILTGHGTEGMVIESIAARQEVGNARVMGPY